MAFRVAADLVTGGDRGQELAGMTVLVAVYGSSNQGRDVGDENKAAEAIGALAFVEGILYEVTVNAEVFATVI